MNSVVKSFSVRWLKLMIFMNELLLQCLVKPLNQLFHRWDLLDLLVSILLLGVNDVYCLPKDGVVLQEIGEPGHISGRLPMIPH